jgi:hypothetical protein
MDAWDLPDGASKIIGGIKDMLKGRYSLTASVGKRRGRRYVHADTFSPPSSSFLFLFAPAASSSTSAASFSVSAVSWASSLVLR